MNVTFSEKVTAEVWRSPLRSEAGVTLAFFALLIAIIVGFAALVVDHSKEEIAVLNLQRASDAAALAAARRLNGHIDGWWDAKRAAMVAIKRNPVHGAATGDPESLRLNGGEKAYWDQSKNVTGIIAKGAAGRSAPIMNSGTEGESGVLKVKVERGLYWNDPESNQYTFIPLEEDKDGMNGGVPYYLVANAVRVTTTLDHLDNAFGGVFGVSVFKNLRREAIAVMDSSLGRRVAPVAIPICQLLFNTDPSVTSGDHQLDRYRPDNQCERATYVAETNAHGDLPTELSGQRSTATNGVVTVTARQDGLVRSESYERPPYASFSGSKTNLCFDSFTGAAINCKALPLYATLGVPSDTPGGEAGADDVIASFASGGTASKIGGYFRPLVSLNGMTEDSSRETIANAINSGNKTFREAFMTGNRPNRNFPFLRTKHINPQSRDPQGRPTVTGRGAEYYDQNISMPADDSGEFNNQNQIKFLMHDMSDLPGVDRGRIDPQLSFTNPMCHDDRIIHNDPDNARVLETYAMVVAPGLRDKNGIYNGNILQYCDWQNVFKGNANGSGFRSVEQQAVAPVPESEPTIVGYVKINIFDLNFQRLATRPAGVRGGGPVEQSPNTPVYLNGNGALWDANPDALNLAGDSGYNDMLNNASKFKDEYVEAVVCKADKDKSDCPKVPTFDWSDYTIPPEWEQCFQWKEFRHAFNRMKTLDGSMSSTRIVNFWIQILEQPIAAEPHMHCLPRLKDGKLDKNSPTSYEKLRPLVAGLGCGGLRARLSCGSDEFSIPTGKEHNSNNPTLVTSGES